MKAAARQQYLLQKYLQNTISKAELKEFWQEMADVAEKSENISQEFYELWEREETVMQQNALWSKDFEELIKRANAFRPKTPVKQVLNRKYLAVAAMLTLLVGAGGLWLLLNKSTSGPLVEFQAKEPAIDVLPGGNKALLTLADGSTIVLDSAKNGTLSSQGNSQIIKLHDGQLAYNNAKGSKWGKALYNTIATPKGGQYQLKLADGSMVWLNAASSLHFPATFAGNERKVILTGEAYFEVSQNSKVPFKVYVNDMEVLVLGTQFNVNAYGDEGKFKTTLLEGSVKVSVGKEGDLLKPGQQALFETTSGKLQKITQVDMNEVLAWKNNELIFNETELRIAMLTLSRWYDFDVIYEDSLPPTYLYGSISRDKGLAEVLKIMDASGLKFRIEKNGTANKLIIMK